MNLRELSERTIEEFRHQMARALASGVPQEELVGRLVQQGLEESLATRLLEHLHDANQFILNSLAQGIPQNVIEVKLSESGVKGPLALAMIERLQYQFQIQQQKAGQRKVGKSIVLLLLAFVGVLLRWLWLKHSWWWFGIGGLTVWGSVEFVRGTLLFFQNQPLEYREKDTLYPAEYYEELATRTFEDGLPVAFPGLAGVEFTQSDPVRIYTWEDFEAYLYEAMEPFNTMENLKYRHIMAVYEKQSPVLAITSEENVLQQWEGYEQLMHLGFSSSPTGKADRHTHFLCMFYEGHRYNYGSSEQWGDFPVFEEKALDLMQETLNLQGDPSLLFDREARLN